jgi:hypothetical protein
MICLVYCFSHHILGQIVLSGTASHHDMRCLWCDYTSDRFFCLRCEFGVDCNDVFGWREMCSASMPATLGGETVVCTL